MTKKVVKELTPYQYEKIVREAQTGEWEFDGDPEWDALHEATVARYGGLGVPLKQIAAMLGPRGMSVPQMMKLYGNTLNRTRAQMNARIATQIYENALAGDPKAMALWAKTQMGWSETVKHTIPVEEKESENLTPKAITRTIVKADGEKVVISSTRKEEEAATNKEQEAKQKEEWLDRLRDKNA